MRKGIPSFDELNPLTQILVIGLFGGLACILSGSGFMGPLQVCDALPCVDGPPQSWVGVALELVYGRNTFYAGIVLTVLCSLVLLYQVIPERFNKIINSYRSLMRSRAFKLYWILVVILTLLDLSSELIPSRGYHLPLEVHSELGYTPLRGQVVRLSYNLAIVNVLHSHVHFGSLAIDEIARFSMALFLGTVFANMYWKEMRLGCAILRITWVSVGSTCFSQGIAFLLFGGVCDWFNVRESPTIAHSLAFSDIVAILSTLFIPVGLVFMLISVVIHVVKTSGHGLTVNHVR
jgi:hypothetical protein